MADKIYKVKKKILYKQWMIMTDKTIIKLKSKQYQITDKTIIKLKNKQYLNNI